MGWNDVGGSGNSTETKYAKFSVGVNVLRMLDMDPVSRWTHWVQQANGGKGVSVTCPGPATCPICAIRKEEKERAEASGQKPKYSYSVKKVHALNGINRATGEVEIVEKGKSLFEQLKNLHTEMGPIIGYDVKIMQSGTKFNEISYTVIPMPVTPLTPEEAALPKFDLVKLSEPWTADQITMAINGATMEEIFPRDVHDDDASDDQVVTA